jgi:hypothetical protein
MNLSLYYLRQNHGKYAHIFVQFFSDHML